jgi:hypothetical protein
MSFKDKYKLICESSYLAPHTDILIEVFDRSEHITEFGRQANETILVALYRNPTTTVIYKEHPSQVNEIQKFIGDSHLDIKYKISNSLNTLIEPTDVLILNSPYTRFHRLKELQLHAHNVNKFLIFPSTHLYGKRDENMGMPGITHAIEKFVADNGEWTQLYKSDEQHGLIILEKEPLGSSAENLYTLATFDIPQVKWVERFKVGLQQPIPGLSAKKVNQMAEKEAKALNDALRYGMILGVERNFTDIQIGGRKVLTGYLVYHVGFRRRPPGK